MLELLSLKPGDVENRRLLAAVTADNGPPTAATDGVATGSPDKLFAVARATAGGSCDVIVWGYAAFCGKWVNVGNFSIDDSANTMTSFTWNGLDRAYVELANIAGAGAEIDVWLAKRFE